jgi:hypothetical protein
MPQPQTPHIVLDAEDAAQPWAATLINLTRTGSETAAARLGLPAPARIRVVSFGNEYEFQRYLGSRPTHVVAVARPLGSEIVILRPALFAQPAGEQQQTLAHEMAHLIIGQRIRGRLPAWLDEGLAQLTARQGEWNMGLRLTFAGTFGTLLSLGQLEDTLVLGGETQTLAYAQGISVTRFLIGRTFPGGDRDSPKQLAQLLADPVEGPKFLERLRDPTLRQALEWQWTQSQKTVWNWIAALSGGGFLWGISTFLFLLAYWRKRRFANQVRERLMVEEERDRELGLGPAPWEYETDEEDFGAEADERKPRGD